MRGILESCAFFCTDYRFMNDKTEFVFGLDVAELMLLECSAIVGLAKADVSDVLDRIAILRRGGRDVSVYCASWSAHENDLSQWRAYAPQDGVCLGFDAQMLTTLAHNQGFSSGPVLYFGESDFDEWFLNQAKSLKSLLEIQEPPLIRYADDYDGPKGEEIQMHVAAAHRQAILCKWIGQVCAAIKHPDFSCEREWRVTFVHVLNGFWKVPKIKTRQSAFRAVPYIDLSIATTSKNFNGLIREVHLGPSNTLSENLYLAGVLMAGGGGNLAISAHDHPLKPR